MPDEEDVVDVLEHNEGRQAGQQRGREGEVEGEAKKPLGYEAERDEEQPEQLPLQCLHHGLHIASHDHAVRLPWSYCRPRPGAPGPDQG